MGIREFITIDTCREEVKFSVFGEQPRRRLFQYLAGPGKNEEWNIYLIFRIGGK